MDLMQALKTPDSLDPVSDQWVENLQLSLNTLPDAYLIETLRGCIVNIAKRLNGEDASEEDAKLILQATLESLVSATGTGEDE